MGGGAVERSSPRWPREGPPGPTTPQVNINLKPSNFATMPMHILKHMHPETRLDKYIEIRGVLYKTTLLLTEMKHQTIAPSEYVHIEGTLHSPICLES